MATENKKTFYTCPMHENILEETPGMCPECGMKLVKTDKKDVTQQKTQDESSDHAHIFSRRFWVSFVLSIPVVAYSSIVQELFGWQAPAFSGSEYIPLVLSTIIFFYGGLIFLQSAWREVRGKSPGMMTLISLAILTAYIYSVAVVLGEFSGDVLFWELATLIVVMLLGHWVEMRAVSSAQGALKELSALLPDTAEVIRNGIKKEIPLSKVRKGDTLFIRPGSRVPADAIVTKGSSTVDESAITGESRPVKKGKGDSVIAGTINGDGRLEARVEHIGEETFLAGVMRLVKDAQQSKSHLQLLSDRAAYWLTIIAVGGGIVAFTGWIIADATSAYAINRAVAVLVIACPHALGLAIPLVAAISTTLAARNGFLIRERLALERARTVDTVLFDKTGTLTTGEYGVEKIWAVADQTEKEVLRLAASIDAHSEHTVSRAIVAEAEKQSISLDEIENFERLPGIGVRGSIDGTTVLVGAQEIMPDKQEIPANIEKEVQQAKERGHTTIYAVREQVLVGIFALADQIRPESHEAVTTLQKQGVNVAMITGDTKPVASWVANELGIDEYFARVMPEDKDTKVRQLQKRGNIVAMVGDGINDAPALTRADVGIAIGAGTNVAIESAGIILVRNDPRDIAHIIELSKKTYTKMVQNLFWATGYNVVALPLAGGALAFAGIVLQPAVAALLMSVSTVIVAVNAVTLKNTQLT